ncbi:MAG: transposase, partial [Blautia sp.]|nr:transposase [Blautia sp.]
LTEKQIRRAVEARFRDTEEFSAESKFRNGVETLPSVLRRRYRVDEMPVRGLKRTKFRFGLSIGGLNFMKLLKFMKGRGSAPKMQPCYS